MTIDFINAKSDVRRQLEKAQREISRLRAREEKPQSTFKLGAAIDRASLEIAVHIPVLVAIGISCFGWEQYGWFAAGLIPLTCSLSWLLSRTYAKLIEAHRLDVTLFLTVLGALAFVTEAYGVHLGLERFNHQNAANGLQTFSAEILILVSIMLGGMNLFSRWGWITGAEHASQAGRPESRWFWKKRRDRFHAGIARNDEPVRLREMPAEFARDCYARNGGWPLGYKPTEDDLAAVTALPIQRAKA